MPTSARVSKSRLCEVERDTLGARIRSLRHDRGLTAEALARAIGVTKGAISQIESGKANPSLSTIRRLADALRTPVAGLFETRLAEHRWVVRRDQRKVMRIPQNRQRYELLTPDLVGKRVEFLRVEYEAQAPEQPEPFAHDGEEYGYVVQGRVKISVGDTTYHLKAGDSIFFPARLPHLVLNGGHRTAVMVWAISPPAW